MQYALCLRDVGSFFETVRENEDKLKNLQMPVFPHDPSDGPTGTQFTCFTGTNAQLLTQLAHDTHLLPRRQLRPEPLMPYALCLMPLADRHVVPRRQLRPPQAARDVQGHSETSRRVLERKCWGRSKGSLSRAFNCLMPYALCF